MAQDRLEDYLRDLERRLRAAGVFDPIALEEIEGHLLESVDCGMRAGLERDAAERQALELFGSPRVVAATFEQADERMHFMQKVLWVLAGLAGLAALYVDSRPTWDDTGVLAGAILLVCGLLGLVGFKRPWLLALLVGAWIPLRAVIITHNLAALLALAFALAGAYAGWGLRWAARKAFRPA